MDVKKHYDNHLGDIYSWMMGDFGARQSEQEEYFRKNKITSKSNREALDLGCGDGAQSVALAKLGFSVNAIDFNAQLLKELDVNKKLFDIKGQLSDITDFNIYEQYNPELVVCMGDTITLLKSQKIIEELFINIHKVMREKGLFIVSFYDLTSELQDNDRFVFTKSDESRIINCFHEYIGEVVKVNDILYENVNSNWVQKISSYNKLRLSDDIMIDMLDWNGFRLLKNEVINKMHYMVFQKS